MSENYIWYASYGSNLSEERFMYYIRGGRPRGAKRDYPGCNDKTPPQQNKECDFDRELYFAGKSKNWDDGGVCFIKSEKSPFIRTIGRMYLITADQFFDVIRQENANSDIEEINLEHVIQEENYIFDSGIKYGNIVYLGKETGYPIFTFTNAADLAEFNKPSIGYLKFIIKGLREFTNYTAETLVTYLASKKGIEGNYSINELMKMCNEVIG